MKRYADYTKDDLMLLLESLTAGGSEFHNEPETCADRIRDHARSVTKQVVARQRAEQQRDSLLAALEDILQWLDNVLPMPSDKTSEIRDHARAAIAAAKGEA